MAEFLNTTGFDFINDRFKKTLEQLRADNVNIIAKTMIENQAFILMGLFSLRSDLKAQHKLFTKPPKKTLILAERIRTIKRLIKEN